MADSRRPGAGPSDGGLGGIFRGLGGFTELVQNLADLAQKVQGQAEGGDGTFSRTGEVGDAKGARAVYGFSVRVGGGGKPHVEQFGNVNIKKGAKDPQIKEIREPLVDVFEEEDQILLVAEMPGVEAGDVRFEVRGETVDLSAVRGERKYRKEITLPAAVDAKDASSSFRNGVFELKLRRLPKAGE